MWHTIVKSSKKLLESASWTWDATSKFRSQRLWVETVQSKWDAIQAIPLRVAKYCLAKHESEVSVNEKYIVKERERRLVNRKDGCTDFLAIFNDASSPPEALCFMSPELDKITDQFWNQGMKEVYTKDNIRAHNERQKAAQSEKKQGSNKGLGKGKPEGKQADKNIQKPKTVPNLPYASLHIKARYPSMYRYKFEFQQMKDLRKHDKDLAKCCGWGDGKRKPFW